MKNLLKNLIKKLTPNPNHNEPTSSENIEDLPLFTPQLLDEWIKAGKTDEVLALLEKYEPYFTTEDYAISGEILLSHNLIDEAIYHLEIAANENDLYAMNHLGFIYGYRYKYKDLPFALEIFHTAIELGDKNAYFSLADLYSEEIEILDLNKALHYAELAIKNGEYSAYYIIGRCYTIRHDYAQALRAFEQLKVHGLVQHALMGIGILHYEAINSEFYKPSYAEELLKKVALEYDSPDKYFELARFYTAETPFKDIERAIQLFKQGISIGCIYSEAELEKLSESSAQD
ncbi:hypothetical protein [Acinetobacter sp. YH12140]|uniref:SEL1-like repeat protein n=1 Tax=Acinetobacter sp. YH12140 TaxID=2601124 RepID=UPI0015D30E11|nr:hypothetical protein [Acinetobacter sp. YH12140]